MAISTNQNIWYYLDGEEEFLISDYELVIDHIKENYAPSSEEQLNNLLLVLVNKINNEEELVEHCMRQNLDPGHYMDPDLAHYILERLQNELSGGF